MRRIAIPRAFQNGVRSVTPHIASSCSMIAYTPLDPDHNAKIRPNVSSPPFPSDETY